jgi:hypothetical protein
MGICLCCNNNSAEPLFYIVSPKDIVVARPRDVDDHITWLLQHDKYQPALEAAQANPSSLKQVSFCIITLPPAPPPHLRH